jgi:L-amino acid N-acyltransferase YncA
VRVFGDECGLATIGRGVVGRTEVSVELTRAGASSGAGRRLVQGALAHLPDDEWVFAQVAPGNAASVRAFLGIGFVPIGSEILLAPDR